MVSCTHKGHWSLTLSITNLEGGGCWLLTNVYGPQDAANKILFLDELLLVGQQLVTRPWCVVGDFNLLLADSDKNNSNVNKRLIGRFRNMMDSLEVQEVYLFGRRYSWSSEQENPTLTKIDKVLVNAGWEDLFRDAHLQALSSSASYHSPLLLACDIMMHRPRRFKFESFWSRLEGFDDFVKETWESAQTGSDAICTLHLRLCATAAALRKWGERRISKLRLQLVVAHEIIFQLDKAQDDRLLMGEERALRATLKGRCLALASLERIRLRKRSRLLFLRYSGTSAQFHQLKINARKCKKAIASLFH